MKRDMDLVREILRTLEARGPGEIGVQIPGRPLDELREHLRIIEDAGLIEGVSFTRSSAMCKRLTWAGHEFLDSIRQDTVWDKAKKLTVEKTGGLALTALNEAVKVVVKALITGTP